MEEVAFEPSLKNVGDSMSLEIGIPSCWEDIPDTGKCERSQQACLRNSRLHSCGAKV